MKRILLTGSRSWKCTTLAARIIDECPTGADLAFDLTAKAAGVAVEPHPADWESYGKSAGPRRNKEMVDAGATLCLAVHKSIKYSKGTASCARLAIAAGIPTYLIDSEDGEPKRLEELP